MKSGHIKVFLEKATGLITYQFDDGAFLKNTVAYINDIHKGFISAGNFNKHTGIIAHFKDQLGQGLSMTVTHHDPKCPYNLTQSIKLYQQDFLLISASVSYLEHQGTPLETRDISPLAILPAFHGMAYIPGSKPRILDFPFDNDDWVNVTERSWPQKSQSVTSGISYEFAAIYDHASSSGLVLGSIIHDFWKTGIAYQTAITKGVIDSLKVFGGAATPDDSSLPPDYGGLDGTHDHLPHGTMLGQSVSSPTIFLQAASLNGAFRQYGMINAIINGRQTWKRPAPFYWNSFGVEGVLGYEGVMMPPAIKQISDSIRSIKNFNAYGKPVLSIDSYDQKIYSTEVLKDLGRYAEKNNQEMGFYFIPFAIWSWKDDLAGRKLPGSDFELNDVLLRDGNGNPIRYKEGKWGAYAMDPTHPAVRLYIIHQLKMAKAINSRFIKVDFLTAGALESSRRYDPSIRTGMQAYNYGMKTLRFLVDSIMGKDIFITQAISPMFPSQYAHTRFISTDVYSHLRNDEKGFPHYGSTEASLANGSHFGWVQGTLWPFTNLDVSIMKNFQHNPDLSEQEIKVRLYAMIAMGSIFGDGSDFRDPIAARRAKEFLNNKYIVGYFAHPKAFLPLRAADGDSADQQLSFYSPGKDCSIAAFNFDLKHNFDQSYSRSVLQLLPNKAYQLKDVMTGAIVDELKSGQPALKITTSPGDARMLKLVPVNN